MIKRIQRLGALMNFTCGLIAILLLLPSNAIAQSAPAGKVKVFILAGQSNMQGQGVVDLDHPDHYNGGKGTLEQVMRNPENAWRFAHLKDDSGKWHERDDVFIRYRTETQLKTGKLTIGFTGYEGQHHIGPELQFGHVVGDAFEEPILLIKTAWGGKSLFADFRPPSAPEISIDKTGNNDVAQSDAATQKKTGGPFYQQMLAEIDEALQAAPTEFPSLKDRDFQISGFVWMQGWNDMVDAQARKSYEENLVYLIHDIRAHFDNAKLPVVIGELGNGGENAGEQMLEFRNAQRAAANRDEFRGNVAFVPTAEFARPADQSPNVGHGHHWFGNAESYYLIGDALGKSMLELLDRQHHVEKDIAYKQGADTDAYEATRCRLDLYIPAAAKQAPTLVWFHGGGLTSNSKEKTEVTDFARYFAERGIIVVAANYRLSPQAKYPAYVEDAAAAVAWALKNIEKQGGDSRQVFVGGHSAGAYLALLVGMDERYLQKHQMHPTDIAGYIPISGQTDSHWTVRAERGIGRDEALIDESAPLFFAGKKTAPMLLIVAEHDLEGRVQLNEQLLQAMHKGGHTDVELHQIASRNHVSLVTHIAEKEDKTATLILDFISKHRQQ
jgi:acetyl esterase/lipase